MEDLELHGQASVFKRNSSNGIDMFPGLAKVFRLRFEQKAKKSAHDGSNFLYEDIL
jgi:hypothetical protein